MQSDISTMLRNIVTVGDDSSKMAELENAVTLWANGHRPKGLITPGERNRLIGEIG